MNKQHWLDVSEYICLAGSALGSIVSVTSGQAIYAAAPLTLAFSVGMANRKRLDRLQQKEQKTALIDIQKNILEDIDRVDSETAKLQEKLNISTQEKDKKLEELNHKLAEFQENWNQENQQEWSKLIPTQLQQLIKRLETLENHQKEILNKRLPWAVSAIEELQDKTATIEPLESNFSYISENLEILTNRVESLPQAEFFGKMETAIISLQKRLDLNPVNFESAVLTDANFSGIYLKHAQLMDANLSGVNFNSACLNSANLTDVDLTRANLIGADLGVANLSYANLNNAQLSQVDLSYANLSGIDLSFANLSGVNLYAANLTDADLSNANLKGANLTNANLSGAIVSYADLSDTNLTNANLSHTCLSNTNLSNANLSGANFWYAELSDVDLSNTLIDRNTKLDRKNQNCHAYSTKSTNTNHNILNLKSPNFEEEKFNDSVAVQQSIIDV